MMIFGERVGAPAFEHAVEVAVPVGQPCGLCEEVIGAGDSGVIEGFLDSPAPRRPAHIECHYRLILGCPGHLDGDPLRPDTRTWREQGRAVMVRALYQLID